MEELSEVPSVKESTVKIFASVGAVIATFISIFLWQRNWVDFFELLADGFAHQFIIFICHFFCLDFYREDLHLKTGRFRISFLCFYFNFSGRLVLQCRNLRKTCKLQNKFSFSFSFSFVVLLVELVGAICLENSKLPCNLTHSLQILILNGI